MLRPWGREGGRGRKKRDREEGGREEEGDRERERERDHVKNRNAEMENWGIVKINKMQRFPLQKKRIINTESISDCFNSLD